MRSPDSILHLNVDPRLKVLVLKAADEAGLCMNEWVAKELANLLSHPELARIPRLKRGRKPKIPQTVAS